MCPSVCAKACLSSVAIFTPYDTVPPSLNFISPALCCSERKYNDIKWQQRWIIVGLSGLFILAFQSP